MSTKKIVYGKGVVGPDVKLTKYERRAYPLAEGGTSVISLFMSMYFIYYATVIAGIDPAIVGTMTLVARIFDAVNDPIMGAIVDRTDTRFGTCRPYLMFGSVFVGISVVLLFAIPNLSMTGKIIWIYVFYILENMMVTVVGIPNTSMMARLTNDGAERVFVNRNRLVASYLMTLAAAILVPVMLSALTPRFAAAGNPGGAYTVSVCAVMLVVCFCYILVGATVRERKFPVAVTDIEKPTLGTCIKILLRNKYWFLITIAATLNYFISGINSNITLYYTNYVLKAGSILTIITMVANFGVPLLVLMFSGQFVVRLGKRKVAVTGILVAAVGMVIRLVMGMNAPLYVYVLGLFLFNGGMAIFTTCQGSGMMDTIEYSEWKFGVRNDGMIVSGYSMASKAGPGFASALVGVMLKGIGFDETLAASSETIQNGIFNIAVIAPLIFLVVFAVLMLFWDLDKKGPQIKSELAVRRASVKVEI